MGSPVALPNSLSHFTSVMMLCPPALPPSKGLC